MIFMLFLYKKKVKKKKKNFFAYLPTPKKYCDISGNKTFIFFCLKYGIRKKQMVWDV